MRKWWILCAVLAGCASDPLAADQQRTATAAQDAGGCGGDAQADASGPCPDGAKLYEPSQLYSYCAIPGGDLHGPYKKWCGLGTDGTQAPGVLHVQGQYDHGALQGVQWIRNCATGSVQAVRCYNAGLQVWESTDVAEAASRTCP
jgi:hypothetical protein